MERLWKTTKELSRHPTLDSKVATSKFMSHMLQLQRNMFGFFYKYRSYGRKYSFHSEDGLNTLLHNVGTQVPNYMLSVPLRLLNTTWQSNLRKKDSNWAFQHSLYVFFAQCFSMGIKINQHNQIFSAPPQKSCEPVFVMTNQPTDSLTNKKHLRPTTVITFRFTGKYV